MASPSKVSLILCASFVALFVSAKTNAQSADDGFDLKLSTIQEDVRVITVQPDGKILIGGEFATVLGVPRSGMARINPDGTLDSVFNPNILYPASGHPTVLAVALQADGKIIVGGAFTTAGGQSRHGFARLDPVTGAADSWDLNPNSAVETMVFQKDGKIVVGGYFTTIGGRPRSHIARLDPVTGVPDSFDPSAHSNFESSTDVFALALQPDGKILVGGFFNTIGGQTRTHIARLDPATGLADSFNPSASEWGQINAIAVQPDGRIVVGGYFNIIGGQARIHMARLDPATGLADSFDPSPGARLLALALQPDGGIVVSGFFASIGGQPRNLIARVDPLTGAVDSFGPNAGGSDTPPIFPSMSALAVQPDGKVLAGGAFIYLNPNGGPQITRKNIARLEKDGFADKALADLNIIGNKITTTAVQPDGKLLIGGDFKRVLDVPRDNIARLNTDGSLDMVFDPGSDGEVDAIAVEPDGFIMVSGEFANIGQAPRRYAARINGVTGGAFSFNGANPNAPVNAVAVQSDGKVLLGGAFTNIGGQNRNRIARLDPISGLADDFNPNADGTINAIVMQSDGRILVGGTFTHISAANRAWIARLDPDTGGADPFAPQADGAIKSITVQSDGGVVITGEFTHINGQTRAGMARLDANGVLNAFDANANATIDSYVIQSDGKIVAGGEFTNIGGAMRNHLARLDGITGAADSYDGNADNGVEAVALLADGKVLAGGDFNNIANQPRHLFARLTNDTAALQDLSATPTTITWSRNGASVQFTRTTFEYSTDNANYTSLGNGIYSGNAWTLSGLNLPNAQNFYIRARGYYRTGENNGSESIAESVRHVFLREVSVANVVSRKVHGSAGAFDINLPRSNPGIECRSGGTSGDYQMVFSFANPITSVGGASVTNGTGSVASRMIDTDAHNYIVNLTGVTNAQVININLTNVNDSAGNSSATVSAAMSVLIGDVNANGSVNASDIAQTKINSGSTVAGTNFRSDANANGSINASDVSLVKSHSGTGISANRERASVSAR